MGPVVSLSLSVTEFFKELCSIQFSSSLDDVQLNSSLDPETQQID